MVKPAEFFDSHAVFRFDEFLLAHAASGASPKTTDALLSYYVATSRLTNLRRGLYARAGGTDPDPWVVGSRLSKDAVIAYDGALTFHGLWPLQHSISFLTRTRASRFVFDEMIYRPVRLPVALGKDWGGHILSLERAGQPLKVTSRERTLVDLLDRLDLFYGSRALWDCFRAARPDWSELISYARRLGNRLVVGRLAVFLQLLGANNRVLDGLDGFAPRSACYFDKREPTAGGEIFPRWNVIVSRRLIAHIESGAAIDPSTVHDEDE